MTPAFFILSLFYWQSINYNQLVIFSLMGASGLLSHWCLAQAFKMSDTTFVMPLQFTKLIWASLIGLFIFAKTARYLDLGWRNNYFYFCSLYYLPRGI